MSCASIPLKINIQQTLAASHMNDAQRVFDIGRTDLVTCLLILVAGFLYFIFKQQKNKEFWKIRSCSLMSPMLECRMLLYTDIGLVQHGYKGFVLLFCDQKSWTRAIAIIENHARAFIMNR